MKWRCVCQPLRPWLVGGIVSMLVLSTRPIVGWGENHAVTDNVVKLYVNTSPINVFQPWQTKGTQLKTGTGFFIDERRILTNAHLVTDASFIQFKRESDVIKYQARLVAVGHECDLALLTVDDERFAFTGNPWPFGDLPEPRKQVTVVGFPEGGEKISFTEGVVSRWELIPYVHSKQVLLGVQIDAAVNPGNSGGPVLSEDKVVGVVMQLLNESQNISYIIPAEVVRHFLKDIEDGRYDGFPKLGVEYAATENPTLRRRFGLDAYPDQGVLVTAVVPYSSAEGVLEKGDVLLAIDGTAIATDGSFLFRNNQRLDFPYLVQRRFIGDRVTLKVLRQGKPLTVSVQLRPYKPLVAPVKYYERPPYVIFAGYVFTVVTLDLVQAIRDALRGYEEPLFWHYLNGAGRLNKDRRQDLICLLHVLPDEINTGYQQIGPNRIVTAVDDEVVISFDDFLKKIKERHQGILRIDLNDGFPIFIPLEEVAQANERVLKRYYIPSAAWLPQK